MTFNNLLTLPTGIHGCKCLPEISSINGSGNYLCHGLWCSPHMGTCTVSPGTGRLRFKEFSLTAEKSRVQRTTYDSPGFSTRSRGQRACLVQNLSVLPLHQTRARWRAHLAESSLSNSAKPHCRSATGSQSLSCSVCDFLRSNTRVATSSPSPSVPSPVFVDICRKVAPMPLV